TVHPPKFKGLKDPWGVLPLTRVRIPITARARLRLELQRVGVHRASPLPRPGWRGSACVRTLVQGIGGVAPYRLTSARADRVLALLAHSAAEHWRGGEEKTEIKEREPPMDDSPRRELGHQRAGWDIL